MARAAKAPACACQQALAQSVAKRERARAKHAKWLASMPADLAAYWAGSITASLLDKPVRVVIAGGCSCGRSEAVAS